MLTCFDFLTVTKLQVPAYWCSVWRHHTYRLPQCSSRQPWYYISLPAQSDCPWTATDGQICLWLKWNFRLFYSQSITDRAVTKLRLGEIFIETPNKTIPANITAGYFATGVYPMNPSVIPDTVFAPSLLTHSDNTHVSNVLTLTETPSTAPLLQQKLGRLLLRLVHLANFCQLKGTMTRWL